MVINGKLHVGEIIDRCWRVEIHDVAADPVFSDLASREALVELSLLLLALGEHLIVYRTR